MTTLIKQPVKLQNYQYNKEIRVNRQKYEKSSQRTSKTTPIYFKNKGKQIFIKKYILLVSTLIFHLFFELFFFKFFSLNCKLFFKNNLLL